MNTIFGLINIGLLAGSPLLTASAAPSQTIKEELPSPESQIVSELDELAYFEGSWRCEQPPNSLSPEPIALDWRVERDLNGAWYIGRGAEVATETKPNPINSQEFLGYNAVSRRFVRMSAVGNGNLLSMASLGWQDEQFVWEGTATTRNELITLRQIITRENDNAFSVTYFVLDPASDDWRPTLYETCERQVSIDTIATTVLE